MNQQRIIPRVAFGWYLYFMFLQVAPWFMALEAPTASQAGWAGAVLTMGTGWFSFYLGIVKVGIGAKAKVTHQEE